jgi:hypothetical protein
LFFDVIPVPHLLTLYYILPRPVIPAKAGIHIFLFWIPACAGMTSAYFIFDENNITLVAGALSIADRIL